MRHGALLSGIAGLGLSLWLLANFGFGKIFDLLATVGFFGFAALLLFHAVQMVFSAWGWRAIAPLTARPMRLSGYFFLRWLREGINNLLPLAQIGGEFVATRLLQQRGERLGAAMAGTVADLTVELASQIFFTVLGLALLIGGAGNADGVGAGIVRYAAYGLGGAVLLVAAACLALRLGVGGLVERVFVRLGLWLGWAGATGIEGFNAALLDCYHRPHRLALSTLWHLGSWLLGAVEVCIALHLLGHDVGLAQGLIIESVGQAVKAVGFAVPGALGIQEGGYVIICRVFGLSPDVALALSLLKRLREVALGVPALIMWRRTARAAALSNPALPGALQ